MSTYDLDDETIAALQQERVDRRRVARFDEVLRQAEYASRPAGELDDDAQRSVQTWERHVQSLNALVDAELEALAFANPIVPDIPTMTVSDDRLHVFGPAQYKHRWVHLDNGQAAVDLAAGTFRASNYTTGPARFTVAQLGVSFRPSVPDCKLSVRAYVRFSGYNILDHRVHQPGTTERRWAWALGSVGLKVDSFNLSGGEPHLDDERWENVWDRGEQNPSGTREFDDSVAVSNSGTEPIAINSRNYIVWITCRVGVSADPGFMVSTYATSSISCFVPYFVVEEIDHW